MDFSYFARQESKSSTVLVDFSGQFVVSALRRAFAALPPETCDISQNMAQYLRPPVPMPGNHTNARGCTPSMKHSPNCLDCTNAVLSLPRHIGRALIWIYRHTLSPLVGYNCRHLPTCSAYGDEAIGRFGLWVGGWMTLARLLRCQPWGTSGIDNVPLTPPPGAQWYLPWRFGRWRRVSTPP